LLHDVSERCLVAQVPIGTLGRPRVEVALVDIGVRRGVFEPLLDRFSALLQRGYLRSMFHGRQLGASTFARG